MAVETGQLGMASDFFADYRGYFAVDTCVR
jgi:hypothetical protein